MRLNLLLSGATGFLGSHLTRAFLQAGHNVGILKRRSSDCSRIADLQPALRMFDIEDGLDAAFCQSGPDCVVHNATCYGRQGESRTQVAATNVDLASQLLDISIARGVTAFLNADTPLGPEVSDYAFTKHQFRLHASALARDAHIRFIDLKLEHMYGFGDTPLKFTARVIQACLANESQFELTSGDQMRDFIHIDDVVEAYKLLLASLNEIPFGYSEFEVGTGSTTSIREFASTVRRLTGAKTRLLFGSLPPRPFEVMHSAADNSALKSLGWIPRHGLTSGLSQVIEMERAAQ
jgi:CDP-paratose synthetase